jgi:Fe2+ or Zn2+ uptake regulation protein
MSICTNCRLVEVLATFEVVRTPTELTGAFRAEGLKVTPQRQLLFRLLHGNDRHPSADVLFEMASAHMPGISLRTVYQTLNDLVAMGELRLLAFSAGPNRFDPNVAHHHHAECDGCGQLRDVYVDGIDELHVDGLDGFAARRANVVFHGLCAACAVPT